MKRVETHKLTNCFHSFVGISPTDSLVDFINVRFMVESTFLKVWEVHVAMRNVRQREKVTGREREIYYFQHTKCESFVFRIEIALRVNRRKKLTRSVSLCISWRKRGEDAMFRSWWEFIKIIFFCNAFRFGLEWMPNSLSLANGSAAPCHITEHFSKSCITLR